MFLFVAPGSGVSINVGKTKLFSSVHKAQKALHRSHLAGPCSPLPRTCRKAWAARQSSSPVRCQHPSQELAGYDTLQILGNRDYFKGEMRHELIWLRRSECEPLRPGDPGVLCGRHPTLFPCRNSSPGFVGMAACDQREFSPELRKRGIPGTPALQQAVARLGPDWERQDRQVRVTACASSCFPERLRSGQGWSRSRYQCADHGGTDSDPNRDMRVPYVGP